jgi:hypothetical protein
MNGGEEMRVIVVWAYSFSWQEGINSLGDEVGYGYG